MDIRRFSRVFAVLVAVSLLVPAQALARPAGPNATPGGGANPIVAPPAPRLVPDGVRVCGHDLSGMTAEEARAEIIEWVKPTRLAALTVTAGTSKYTLSPSSVFYTDVDTMVEEALAAPGPMALRLRFGVDTAPVTSLLANIARGDRRGVDAKWIFANGWIKVQRSVVGRSSDVVTGRRNIVSALKREALTQYAQPAAVVPVRVTQPKVTEKSLGRAILVDLSERRLRLFDGPKGGAIIKTYRCAVGQPAWPTPTGLFEIVLKRYMPTWVNPGSSWGSGMPAEIGPGPNNPLGTRALNLNADGIRIHGTENVDSIGTAASHGCMRLVRHDIEELYDLVVVGTPVYIVK